MTEQREGMTELGEGKTELDKLIKAAYEKPEYAMMEGEL